MFFDEMHKMADAVLAKQAAQISGTCTGEPGWVTSSQDCSGNFVCGVQQGGWDCTGQFDCGGFDCGWENDDGAFSCDHSQFTCSGTNAFTCNSADQWDCYSPYDCGCGFNWP